jgi:lysyl-tRNA synthetase class 2
VRRHGSGTLDYFALRDDKQWFFHRDSLVAYAVHGGVCLVSPDPIGPASERVQVWQAMRRYADRHGWALGVTAAAEEWLPLYRDAGMRYLYIGDEAVVDVTSFRLDGGHMKGLRQAVNRVGRKGYTFEILDPALVGPGGVPGVTELIERNRRGDNERGFSMTLGRVFDQRDGGLLLAVVRGPDGTPAAACQFVPSPAIGGYSLDLMRRDPGEHPNGLLDFALVNTIEHVRATGGTGLSLNFAAMRSVLEGEHGDGLTQRVERWALRRLSGALQIESLWRFNAKYDPAWSPRYVVWDSAEQFVPTLVQILRTESLTDLPVVGRLFG